MTLQRRLFKGCSSNVRGCLSTLASKNIALNKLGLWPLWSLNKLRDSSFLFREQTPCCATCTVYTLGCYASKMYMHKHRPHAGSQQVRASRVLAAYSEQPSLNICPCVPHNIRCIFSSPLHLQETPSRHIDGDLQIRVVIKHGSIDG